MHTEEILAWLREDDPQRLQALWTRADAVRRAKVGDEVHLRGLVEISSHCRRHCTYCGLRNGNRRLERYRLSLEQILGCADEAVRIGCQTLVLQAGEDDGLSSSFLETLIRAVRERTGLAITLSLGERSVEELARLRAAGADRYLLRFETSNLALFSKVHPALAQGWPSRLDLYVELRRLGYELGGGVMVGLTGTRYDDLARDIEWFETLDLDMIGVGPYIPHPATPLGKTTSPLDPEQVPATPLMTFKVLALARLACPQSNIPATTALAALDPVRGRELGLQRGANVWMPNLTPAEYRKLYDIYPGKTPTTPFDVEPAEGIRRCLERIGRHVGSGRGDSPRHLARTRAALSLTATANQEPRAPNTPQFSAKGAAGSAPAPGRGCASSSAVPVGRLSVL